MATSEIAATRVDSLITRGKSLLATARVSEYGYTKYVDHPLYEGWRAQTLTALRDILGPEHTYTKAFDEAATGSQEYNVRSGISIVEHAAADIANGYLAGMESLIAGEVFGNFLEMAEHLLQSGYKDPAASLCGAVLENGLRRICENHSITVGANDDLSALNQKCTQAKLYNNLVRQQIQQWTTLRNYADHGKFAEYSKGQVVTMVTGIRDFLAKHT